MLSKYIIFSVDSHEKEKEKKKVVTRKYNRSIKVPFIYRP